MPTETTESSTASSTTEPPSYSPPANEPQGLDPASEAKETKETTGTAATDLPVKLPASIKPPVKTGRFQERISDLVNQRDTSKREAEQLRDELARLKTSAKPGEQEAVANAEGELNPEDFPTYGAYVKAVVKAAHEENKKADQSTQAKQQYEQHKQERTAAFNEHVAPLAEQYGEGFWDTITDPSLPITEAMADAVMELDQLGPYTMLYLAAHRDEAAKISKLNPRAATIAIGRLASQLEAELKQGEQGGESGGDTAQTNNSGGVNALNGASSVRPTPVPVPRGSSPSLNTLPSDKDTPAEWARKEAARMRSVNPNLRMYVPHGN